MWAWIMSSWTIIDLYIIMVKAPSEHQASKNWNLGLGVMMISMRRRLNPNSEIQSVLPSMSSYEPSFFDRISMHLRIVSDSHSTLLSLEPLRPYSVSSMISTQSLGSLPYMMSYNHCRSSDTCGVPSVSRWISCPLKLI